MFALIVEVMLQYGMLCLMIALSFIYFITVKLKTHVWYPDNWLSAQTKQHSQTVHEALQSTQMFLLQYYHYSVFSSLFIWMWGLSPVSLLFVQLSHWLIRLAHCDLWPDIWALAVYSAGQSTAVPTKQLPHSYPSETAPMPDLLAKGPSARGPLSKLKNSTETIGKLAQMNNFNQTETKFVSVFIW